MSVFHVCISSFPTFQWYYNSVVLWTLPLSTLASICCLQCLPPSTLFPVSCSTCQFLTTNISSAFILTLSCHCVRGLPFPVDLGCRLGASVFGHTFCALGPSKTTDLYNLYTFGFRSPINA